MSLMLWCINLTSSIAQAAVLYGRSGHMLVTIHIAAMTHSAYSGVPYELL